MKSLYVTSVERYSGKTAVCLAIGKHLQADGYRVGYMKPVSLQPWRLGSHIVDEDATFVREVLGLSADPWVLSPIVVTPDFLHQQLVGEREIDLSGILKTAADEAGKDQDILLLEGGASLREGYVVGLPTPVVADLLGSRVLVIVKYRDDVRLLDDALAAVHRLGAAMSGVLINRVPDNARDFVSQIAIPFLEAHKIPVFGVLPEKRGLQALSVGEIITTLGAQILTKIVDENALVENLTVGAMTAEAALSRFRKQINKAVITGGDRTDIQLAALETSTTCLILTGNLHPSPLIVKQAEEFGVCVLLVPTNTMETVERIEDVFGKTRLGQPAKLAQFEELIQAHVDLGRLYKALDL